MAKDKWGYDPDYDGESPDVDDEDMIAQLQAGARSGGGGNLKPPPKGGCAVLALIMVSVPVAAIYGAIELLG